MKTWQIIKALSENQNLKFKSPIANNIVLFNPVTRCIEWCVNGKSEDFILMFNPKCGIDNLRDIEWELVREQVDFMTAINSGKPIRPVNASYSPEMPSWFLDCLSLRLINSKWYIEE